MAALPIDTSITGYTSGSVDKQDDIYRNRPRLQPYPIVQNDSGYGSAIKIHSSSFQTPSSSSFLSFVDSVKCSELLNNESNFAPSTAVECYESDDRSISMCRITPGVRSWSLRSRAS